MGQGKHYRTAGRAAAALGISVKALRVYERHGLVTPERTAAGYRVYGPAQMRRLHQIVALKSLGLSLAAIGACLRLVGDDLAAVLEAQETALRARRASLDAALGAVVTARRRLAAGEALSADDLVTLTKEIRMTEEKPDWRTALAPLFAEHLPGLEGAASDGAGARAQLLAEARSLLGTDPGAPAARHLARRWQEHASAFVAGDAAKLAGLRAVLDEALARPELAATLPWRDELAFIQAATARLEAAR